MKWISDKRHTAPTQPHPVLWMLSLLLTGFGARLWLIHKFGTPLPFWDQWEEVRYLFVPYFEGKLTFADWFRAHNEHRIFFTRIYDLAMLLWNGQWDNLLQMVVNALIYCVILCGFGWLLARFLGHKFWPLITLILMVVLVLPFAWENTLAGFHALFYFTTFFSLVTIWLLGFHRPGSLPWFCGIVAGLCSICSLISGLFGAAAVFGLVVLRILLKPATWKQNWATLAVCLVIILIGLSMSIEVPYHQVLKAHSIFQFLSFFGRYLAWPWIVLAPFAAFNMFPLLLLLWLYVRDPEAQKPGEEMVLVLGLWAVLGGLASAYARGAQMFPQWRYMDSACFIMISNALALALLATRHFARLPFRRYFRAATVLWVMACISGLGLLCWRAWQVDIPVRQMYHRLQLWTTRAYLATGDRAYLQTHEKEYLARFATPSEPQDHPQALINMLNLPRVRSLLPARARDPLKMLPETVSGFVTNSFIPVRPQIPGEVAWSSVGAVGTATKGRFESFPVQPGKLPYLEFPIAGDLSAPGLSLDLLEVASGRLTRIQPGKPSGQLWQYCQVKAPPGPFKIVATAENESVWFAFQAPREMGRLSWLAERATSVGGWFFSGGLALYLAGIVLIYRPRRANQDPQSQQGH